MKRRPLMDAVERCGPRPALGARVVWALVIIAAAAACALLCTGCSAGSPRWPHGEVVEGILGGVMLAGLGVLVLFAVRQTRRNELQAARALRGLVDRFRDLKDDMARVEAALPADDLGRILAACLVEARAVRHLVSAAQQSLGVEDYEESLRAAHDRQCLLSSCLAGVVERLPKSDLTPGCLAEEFAALALRRAGGRASAAGMYRPAHGGYVGTVWQYARQCIDTPEGPRMVPQHLITQEGTLRP